MDGSVEEKCAISINESGGEGKKEDWSRADNGTKLKMAPNKEREVFNDTCLWQYISPPAQSVLPSATSTPPSNEETKRS